MILTVSRVEFFTSSFSGGIFDNKLTDQKMGLLLRQYKIVIAFVLVCTDGCGVLRMYEPVKVRFNDWAMYGGNPQRTHLAQYGVQLPLEQVWEYDAGAGFANFSAAVAESLVFVGTLQGELHAVRIVDGKRVGATDLGSAIVGTPIVANNLVYVSMSRNGDNLIAYDLLRGGIAWRVKTGDIETSLLMLENRLYLTTLRGELLCVERFTGDIAWQYEIPSRDRRIQIHSSPAANFERIFFGADDGKLYAISLKNGKPRWSFTTARSIVATPSVNEGRVFVGSTDHSFYCIDAEKGTLVWKSDLGSAIYATQAIDRERVYVGTVKGEFFCLDQRTGEVLWNFNAGSVINAAPLISGDVVFVGSLNKQLYALDAGTGHLLWSKEFSSRIKTTPVAWKGNLIVLLEDRKVVALVHKELSVSEISP
jgi:outer membrane protein assembly factor BamB